MEFRESTVIVTGAAMGLGRRFCERFAEEGARVAVLDIDAAGAEGLRAELARRGHQAIAVQCDVADADSVEQAVEVVAAEFGGVDVLVNNAGRHLSKYGQPFSKLSRADIRELFDVNLFGTINCSLAVHRPMRDRGGGAIVNIASHGGHDVRNAYGVSKLAVRGVAAAFARDYAADGIRVNAVSPGLIATDSMKQDFGEGHFANVIAEQLVPRPGTPDDVADTVLFLTSSRSAFITGQSILLNGGRSVFI